MSTVLVKQCRVSKDSCGAHRVEDGGEVTDFPLEQHSASWKQYCHGSETGGEEGGNERNTRSQQNMNKEAPGSLTG